MKKMIPKAKGDTKYTEVNRETDAFFLFHHSTVRLVQGTSEDATPPFESKKIVSIPSVVSSKSLPVGKNTHKCSLQFISIILTVQPMETDGHNNSSRKKRKQ